MGATYQVKTEPLRSTAFGSITNAYVAIGTPLANPSRILSFINTTDQGVLVSDDGTNDKFIVPAGAARVFDLNANRRELDQMFAYQTATQFYIQYVAMPSKGSFYVETIYGAIS